MPQRLADVNVDIYISKKTKDVSQVLGKKQAQVVKLIKAFKKIYT